MSGFSQPEDNYYSIITKMQTYFDAHPALKNSQDGEYAAFQRWCALWKNRVDGFDQDSSGSFNIARQAWQQYLSNKDQFSSSVVTGVDWKCIGPKSLTYQNLGMVVSIYVDTINDKSKNTIYIGSATSGIWKTTDAGQNWHNCTDGSGLAIIGVTDIKGDPTNGNILYATIGGVYMGRNYSDGIGILKSENKGVTWEIIYPKDQNHHMSVNKLLLDPTDSQIIYACIDDILIRSINGGEDWDTIFKTPRDPEFLTNYEVRNIRDIEFKPFDRNILYVGTDDQAPWGCHFKAQVWKLSNITAQDTSQIIKSRMDQLFPFPDSIRTDRFEIAVTPADPEAIFVECATIKRDTINVDTSRVCLFKFDGNSWKLRLHTETNKVQLEGLGLYKNTLLVSPKDTNILYIGGNFLIKFNQLHFSRFQPLYPGLEHNNVYHIDTRFALIAGASKIADTGSNDILFVGNDGGISRSLNGGASWESLNGNGLSITQFWGLGGLKTDTNTFACGSQDNCMFIYNKNLTQNWQNPTMIGGDCGDVVFDPFYPSIFNFSQWGSGSTLIRYDTIGQAGPPQTIHHSTGEPTQSSGRAPIILNPINKKSLYWGFHHLYRTSDRGINKTQIFIDTTNNNQAIDAFCISPSDTCRIFASFPRYTETRLIRSSFQNGSYSWDNLTSHLAEYSNYYDITAIEVSPTNSDSVWIGFGGFLHNGDNQRIMLSTDGGEQWQKDYSVGLPNMPVNCIKFTNWGGRIFVGTDVGVFYRDRTMSRWQPFNVGLPQCIVTDLEINENEQIIRAATFGRGIYEASLNCLYKDEPYVLNQNQTWSNDTVLENSVYIDSSYTLTIHCRVEFPPSAKIYVKQGGKLIVDSGFLTSHCSNMWQGIEVWGRSKIPQNLPYQGLVCIKRNSVIENARIGITTCQKNAAGEFVGNTTGGIIVAQNCYFRNNYKAIEYVSYPHTVVGELLNVTFETTAPLIDGISYPSELVSLYEVNGVYFKGCKFINRTSSYDTIPTDRKGTGIYSISSTFAVNKWTICPQPVVPCPAPIDLSSSFTGLFYGIKAIDFNSGNHVNISKTNFNNNYRGIYLGSLTYPVITQDTFSIPKGVVGFPSTRDTCYGLYLDRCSLYKVEEDSLRLTDNGLTNTSTKTVGIIVNNSGKDVNEIYNNHFNKVKFGIIAQNLNRNIYDTTGLCIKCNDFSNTSWDIVVDQEFNNPDWGIARNQGWKRLLSDPAGNTFSQSHIGGSIVQFADINNQNALINYYYHSKTSTYKRVYPTYSDTVTPKVILKRTALPYWTKLSACPSKISNGNGTSFQTNLKQQLTEVKQFIDSISITLNNLTDGGNTLGLNSTVASSTPSDSSQLRQTLLNSSPYLSDTVMKSAIQKDDVLNNEMIRDILVANPQAPKSEGVMEQLNNRAVTMPDSLLTEIQNGIDIMSAKDSLGAELYNHLQARSAILNQLVTLYKSDTVNPDASHDSLISLLYNEKTLSARYLLAFEYLKAKDTVCAHNVLINIPTTFNLDNRDLNLHGNYLAYFYIMNELAAQEKSIFEMSPEQLAKAQTLMLTAGDPVQSLARNILIAHKLSNYEETVIFPDVTKSTKERLRFIKTGKIKEMGYMKIYPNPAKQFIIVEYDLNEKFKSGQEAGIFITNAEGKRIENKFVSKQKDQISVITSSLPVGMYICTLSVNGKTLESQKFIITD